MAPCSRSEFSDLLAMLESSSLIALKGKGPDKGMYAATLSIQPGEVEEGVAGSQVLAGLVDRAAALIKA